MDETTKKSKGSFFLGFSISFTVMVFLLIIIANTIIDNYQVLGALTFYPFLGVVLIGLISRIKKIMIYKLVLISIGIELILLFISYFEVLKLYRN